MLIEPKLIIEAIISGFILGLTTGPICMGTCLPIIIPFSLEESRSNSKFQAIIRFLGKFLAGRFIAYVFFGLAVGFLGSIIRITFLNKLSVIIMIIIAGLLISYGLGIKLFNYSLCKKAFQYSKSKNFSFIIGLFTGVNLCAPFLVAIFYSFERSSTPLFGVVFFIAFFFSTSIFLLPVVLIKYLPKGTYLLKISQIMALIAGVFFLYRGVMLFL